MSITYIDRPIEKNQAYQKNLEVADKRYFDFLLNGPEGAVLHSIGTPQPSAKVIGDYFDSPDVEASVHMVLQADGLCYRLAPDRFRMWHGGGTVNNTHLGIEMTEPREISYDPTRGYRLTIHDRAAVLSHVKQTYQKAVELFGDLCMQYDWDPMKDGVILSHKECYERGIGSNHGDPEHLWDALNTGYSMDTFRRAVADLVKLRKGEVPRPAPVVAPIEEVREVRYKTLGELREDDNAVYYLPTVEKLIEMGVLLGKGGSGDDRVLDLSEDAIRILVLLDRVGLFS